MKGLLHTNLPIDLGNRGPSGPDRTTKIFRTGPKEPGPDLSEKECDKMVQKMPEFDYAQCLMLMYCLFLSLCY